MTNHSGNFRLTHALWMAGVIVGVVGIMATCALSQQEKGGESKMFDYVAAHDMDTGCLGGVNPTSKDLAAMQQNQYILHARGGELTKVLVEKSVLPDSPPPLEGSLETWWKSVRR